MKLLLAYTLALGLYRIFPGSIDDFNLNTINQTDNMMQDTIKKPTVFIDEKMVQPMTILVITDTAPSVNDIGSLINKDYGELFTFANRHGIKVEKVMAFYNSYEPPFIFDAAIEIDKIPGVLTGRMHSKHLEGGNAAVAHYRGPYEQVEMAYIAIANWLKEHKKEARDKPFEVYLNDPSTVKDPFELRTDVYQVFK